VLDLFGSIQPLHAALDYHLERHNVLASNVAHVDTPGFVPRDLARTPATSFPHVMNVVLARTEPGHLVGHDWAMPVTGRVFRDPASGAGNDRNYVSLDREAGKLAANQIRFDVTSAIAAAELAQLAYAAGDGR
jgi:flagellar basal-body rod protein FlgB